MFSKVTKKVVAIALVLSLAIATAQVAPSLNDSAKAASKLKMSKKKLTMKVGGKDVKLKCKGAKSWKSSNKKVATVKKGVVSAKAAGKATITAKAGKKSATCKVTVKAAGVGTVIYDLAKEEGADSSTGESYAPPVVCKYETWRYNWGAIWLCRATFYDPASGGKDYRGRKIKCQLTVKNQCKRKVKQLLFQTNNTKPKNYPIVGRIKNLKKGETRKATFTFTIAKNAENGDKDSKTGKPFPIMFFCAWKIKPAFKKGDKFTFTKCKFTVVG